MDLINYASQNQLFMVRDKINDQKLDLTFSNVDLTKLMSDV